MRKIVFASGNQDKVKEIREILGDSSFEIVSLKEAGIEADIVEDGETFVDNALIKAREIKKLWDGIVIADDSGLVIDALGGEPGVKSSRFMGEDTPYTEKCSRILEMLKDVKGDDRSARFVCAMAAVLEDGSEIVVEETIEGVIGPEYVGENGFGYDPIFYVPELKMTTAEMDAQKKHEISHRGKAMRKLQKRLTNEI